MSGRYNRLCNAFLAASARTVEGLAISDQAAIITTPTTSTSNAPEGQTHAPDHPDRELLNLVAEYHRLRATEDQKSRIEKARIEAVEQLIPPAPEELFYRETDHTELGFPAWPPETFGGDYAYDLKAYDALRAKFGRGSDDAATGSDQMSKARAARLTQIEDGLQWWMIACEDSEEILGADIATREARAAMDARIECGLKILVMEAVSDEGREAKAQVAHDLTVTELINFDKIDRDTQLALMEAAVHHLTAA